MFTRDIVNKLVRYQTTARNIGREILTHTEKVEE